MANVPSRFEDSRPTHGSASAGHDESSKTATASPHPPPGSLELNQLDRDLAPQLALRSDGVVLLSIEDLAGYDLSRRKRWTGIELTSEELGEVRRRFTGAAAEAVAHVAGKLGKKKNNDA